MNTLHIMITQDGRLENISKDNICGSILYTLSGLVHRRIHITFIPGSTKTNNNPIADKIFRYLFNPFTIIDPNVVTGDVCYMTVISESKMSILDIQKEIEEVISNKSKKFIVPELREYVNNEIFRLQGRYNDLNKLLTLFASYGEVYPPVK